MKPVKMSFMLDRQTSGRMEMVFLDDCKNTSVTPIRIIGRRL